MLTQTWQVLQSWHSPEGSLPAVGCDEHRRRCVLVVRRFKRQLFQKRTVRARGRRSNWSLITHPLFQIEWLLCPWMRYCTVLCQVCEGMYTLLYDECWGGNWMPWESSIFFQVCSCCRAAYRDFALVDTVPTSRKHGTYLLTQPGDIKMNETGSESGLQPGMWIVLVCRTLLAVEHLSLTKKQGLETSFWWGIWGKYAGEVLWVSWKLWKGHPTEGGSNGTWRCGSWWERL